MNEDEKRMVEEMAKIIAGCGMSDCAFCNGKHKCLYYKSAEILYNANCRIIYDDEIVVTKRQYEQLKKHNTDRKRLRNKWQTEEREAEYWKNRCKEIGDVASRETAREILQKILYTKSCEEWFENEQLVDFGKKIVDKIENLANKYGVDLEETDD